MVRWFNFGLAASLFLYTSLPAQARVIRYLTGNSADVVPVLVGPAHDFGGGGTDVDPAIQWMINQVRGCTDCTTKVDVVVQSVMMATTSPLRR